MQARSAEEIPIEELRVLAKGLFDKVFDRQQIVIEMGHRLGFQRIRKSTRDRLESAVPTPPLIEEN